MIGRIILFVAAFCLITGCDAHQSRLQSNAPTAKASNPNPANGAKGISPYTKLTWTADESIASFDIYFGTESPPTFVRKQDENTFDPGPLDWDTTYYWRINTPDGGQGDIWRFTTFWYGDPNAEEMDVKLNNHNKSRLGFPSQICAGK